ncbi:MAG TPA: hypothetical protein VIL44_08785 [Micromonospora sp.]
MSEVSQLDAPVSTAGEGAAVASRAWAVVIPEETYETERLFHHDTLEVPGVEAQRPAVGDSVLVIAKGERPAVVAVGRVAGATVDAAPGDNGHSPDSPLRIAYTRRCFDEPIPAGDLALDAAVTPLDAAVYQAYVDRLRPSTPRSSWLVNLALPIEAPSAAEAVRQFWSYVMELGPRELPAFVSPSGDELAMRAFVLGEETNLDPEEDE